jgi:hypothetical protein
MLERLTMLLNVVAAIIMLLTGIYLIYTFSDIFSPGAKVMIGAGVMLYSFKQVEVTARGANKN